MDLNNFTLFDHQKHYTISAMQKKHKNRTIFCLVFLLN